MRNRSLAAILVLAGLASCAPRPAPPAPTPPAPQPQLRPEPPRPEPAPPPAQWADAPLSPGDWSYRSGGGTSAASFGTEGAASFVLRCEPNRQVSLALPGAARGPITVRTSSGARNLSAETRQGALVAGVAASEALLDEIAFSRGRFAVEAQGTQQLILPSWGEPARVIEDCRR